MAESSSEYKGKRPATTTLQAPEVPISPKKAIVDDIRGNANVEGLVTHLSPMKKKRSDHSPYFDGQLSDGQQLIRFVGFSEALHEDLARFHQTRETVLMKNCNLYKGKNDKETQLFINTGKTTFEKSDSVYDIKPDCSMMNTTITLDETPLLQKYTKVDFKAKVITVKTPMTVGHATKKTIQKVIIADTTKTATLQLWEEDINTLDEDTSYQFTNITVGEFYQEKYFTFTTESSATQIPDIANVADHDDDMQMSHNTSKECDDAIVVGVTNFQQNAKCLTRNCKGKLNMSTTNSKIATCENCQMIQRLDQCETIITAKILVKAPSLPAPLNLFASSLHLSTIANLPQEDVTQEALLLSQPFSLTYRGSTLSGVYRKM